MAIQFLKFSEISNYLGIRSESSIYSAFEDLTVASKYFEISRKHYKLFSHEFLKPKSKTSDAVLYFDDSVVIIQERINIRWIF